MFGRGIGLLDTAQRDVRLVERPTRKTLRALTLAMPNARVTRHGNVNVQNHVPNWSCESTFLVADHPELSSHRAVSRCEEARIATLQERYADRRGMIALNGVIGGGTSCRLRVRLYVEPSCANIAAVQEMLYFPTAGDEGAPEATVFCTPGLRLPGRPNGRAVTVDFAHALTRVCGTDFVGESKRAGLRMWSKLAWERGGLPLHAAVVRDGRAGGGGREGVLVGRPGTGKSTLAFHDGAEVIACQEDRVAWMRDGSLVPAENAFFSPARLAVGASTTIRHALRAAASHLENVPQRGDALDLTDVPGGAPGRVVFTNGEAMSGALPHVVILLVRNQNVLPAVARLEPAAGAAAYVAALEGQILDQADVQTLGANPLFPLSAVAQGTRLLELLAAHSPEIYVLNTGRVGGPPEHAGSRDIEPRHSAAIVAALLAGVADWEHEATLGCDVAVRLPGFDPRDDDLLRPRALYRRQDRADEYAALAHRLMLRWAGCGARLADFNASLTA